MKELSIEEKAKAYDEAIERAKKWRNAPNVDKIPTFANRVIEEIFPELVESEDERIRCTLINHFKTQVDLSRTWNGLKNIDILAWLEKQEQKPAAWSEEDKNMLEWVIEYLNNRVLNTPISEERTACKNAIAWLEKQGEHIKFRDSIQVGDKVTRNEDGMLVNLSQLKRTAKKDEKQGEQKPAEWSEEDDKMYNSLTEFEKAVKQVMEEAIECGDTHNLKADADMLLSLVQKPAWSEKDEMFVHGLIRGLAAKRDIHGYTTFSSDCIDITNTISWLKSLKDRVYPSQEWSEEDEDYINDLIEYFNGAALQHDVFKVVDWLKSLRPNRWKPSDAQMASITCAVRNMKESACYDSELISLLNDLKKLKE